MGHSLEYNATIVGRTDMTDALSRFSSNPTASSQESVVHPRAILRGRAQQRREARSRLGAAGHVDRLCSRGQGPIEFYIAGWPGRSRRNPLTHLLWKLTNGDRIYMRTVAAGVFTIKDTIGVDDPRIRVDGRRRHRVGAFIR